jgi:(1->4)-alpha-D-glucan 1-alpha-D-glucosylmutase
MPAAVAGGLDAGQAGAAVNPDLRIPRATYRLQLHRGFTFRDATALVPYLHRLGISHVYCSPFLRARAGSTHGYDIVDHRQLNPEIGSREDYDRLVRALADHGMGQVMDVVPNHMGVMGADNAWWLDVLENGQASAYAHFFDIDWQPPHAHLRNKVLVPVLGDHYGACLDRGELALGFDADAGTFAIRYFEHLFPLGPRSYAGVLDRAAERLQAIGGDWAARLRALAAAFAALPHRDESAPDIVALRQAGQVLCKRQLAGLCREREAVGEAIRASVQALNADGDALHGLLEQQAYRLAFWRVAADQINYRRFFDINDLAALRVEDESVFEATHALVLDLVRDGAVHALRIDHPDGLLDPAAYFRRLQQRYREHCGAAPDERLYVAVEKIIAPFEDLPADWDVDGTTGYRFANVVNGLFVDGGSERRFTRVYQAFVGDAASYDEVAQRSKRLVLRAALASELTVLAGRLERIALAGRDTRDYTLDTLRQALTDVIAAFPVYRTYVAEAVSTEDRRYIEWAVARARRHSRSADAGIFDFLRAVLLRELPVADAARGDLALTARKFQQLTAPVMAKGAEDTAFYVYNRLISLNDVGGDPAEFGIGVNAFHGASADRAARWPHTLLASSTHDNKRSEDVRARIDVLSESPAAWRKLLSRWSRLNRSKKRRLDGEPAPSRNDEYFVYQTLVGSFPASGGEGPALEAYRDRVCATVRKAVREAKQRSSWVNPDAEYEAATEAFVQAILAESPHNLFLGDLRQACADIGWYGMLNSLSLVLVKLTSPGVPDIYQGNETLDLSLVDPDNRRPVDYGARRAMLDALEADGVPAQGFHDLLDGRAKLYFTWKLLGLRRERERLFREAGYEPLRAEGERGGHVVAYARRSGDAGVIVVAGRLFTRLAQPGRLPCGESAWGATRVLVPFLEKGARLAGVLDGRVHEFDGEALPMAQLWHTLPGAVLAYG